MKKSFPFYFFFSAFLKPDIDIFPFNHFLIDKNNFLIIEVFYKAFDHNFKNNIRNYK